MKNVRLSKLKLLSVLKFGLGIATGIFLFNVLESPAEVLEGFLDALN